MADTIKLFVENSIQVKVYFDGAFVYDFTAHPNMLVLPLVGQSYTLNEVRADQSSYADSGIVTAISVEHTSTESNAETGTLRQVVNISCVSPTEE